MALVNRCVCDRCGEDAGEGRGAVLWGLDVCNRCIEDARRFLTTPPCRARRTSGRFRLRQALEAIAISPDGIVDAKDVAMRSGESRDNLVYSWKKHALRGNLVHLGGTRFAAPASKAVDARSMQAGEAA